MFLVSTFCVIVKNSPIYFMVKKALQFFPLSKLVSALNFVNIAQLEQVYKKRNITNLTFVHPSERGDFESFFYLKSPPLVFSHYLSK
jgi:hypothetical protein